MKYSEKLKDPRWQKKRLEILKRDNWKCKLCGDTETMLQVHHKEYTADEPWDEPNKNLMTLCKDCHTEIGKKEFKDCNIDKVKVIKVGFDVGSRIMVISSDGKFCIATYNDDIFMGFVLTKNMKDIRSLINYTIRHGKTREK